MSAVLSPQEMVARLARSYLESYRRAGIEATEREIAALAIADCELVDAARRAGELHAGPRVTTPLDHNRERSEPLVQAQAETNTRLTTADADTIDERPKSYRPRVFYRNPMLVSERWGAAVARIGRILEGAGRASTIAGSVDGAEIPKLARAFSELWSYYLTRDGAPPTSGVDHNPFRGLSDKDASRLFMRKTEDIADKSTRQLGAWFVK